MQLLNKLNHEEMKNLNRPITSKEIESEKKKRKKDPTTSQQRKTQDQMVSL